MDTSVAFSRSAFRVFFLLLAFVFWATDAAAQAEFQPSFFGTRELRSSNMAPFKHWNGAMQKYTAESAQKLEGSCEAKQLNACNYAKLVQFLNGLKGKDKLSQVKAVNGLINKAKYITDQDNWGQKDYWASPGEFMARFGDCEDYAIAKFVALGLLGFRDAEMRVVAVKDLNLKVGHAILVVFVDGKTWVLDNQIQQVVEAGQIRHYQPVFSINKNFWWRHVK